MGDNLRETFVTTAREIMMYRSRDYDSPTHPPPQRVVDGRSNGGDVARDVVYWALYVFHSLGTAAEFCDV